MASKKQSRRYTLNWQDLLKGFIVAVIMGALSTLLERLDKGEWFTHESLVFIAKAAIGSGIAYLLKNFLTDSNGSLGKTEKAVEPYTFHKN